MSKEKKKTEKVHSTNDLLNRISDQLERLIVCEEKKLSGQIIENFNSAEYIKGGS